MMMRIVIADDDTLFLENLVRHMPWQELGYEVVGTANDGEKAIEICQRLCPDVLLTDVRMPDLDGIESAEQILNHLKNCHVIFMSAYASKKDYRSALRMKAADFLEKPLTMEELSQTLREVYLMANPKEQSRQEYSKTIEAVISYIKMHYAQELSVSMLARMVCITPNYLSSLFRKETGKTLSVFLVETRMAIACNLLANSRMSVKEISALVGYKSVERFFKVFHQTCGTTPVQYRKNH